MKETLRTDLSLNTTPVKEAPLRAHTLTIDQLQERGSEIAFEHVTHGSNKPSRELRARFQENCVILQNAYVSLGEAARNKEVLTPGAEWLLDNYHVIEQQIREIKKFFPSGYDRTLPKLASGDLMGYPRVYHIALEVVTHSDAIVDTELLSSFVSGYQRNVALTSGELWAVPIMLKFALIENLRRLIATIVISRNDRKAANDIMRELFAVQSAAATDLLLAFAKKVEVQPSIINPSAVHLIRRLREKGSKAMLTLQWLEEKLRERRYEPDELLREDHQAQAFDQISIGNSVTSLRTMSSIDWREWFEGMSVVHHDLLADPAGVYAISEFSTRDLYRHHIEQLARATDKTESEVAKTLIKICERYQGERGTSASPQSHIGYYLIDEGRTTFEKELKLPLSSVLQFGRLLKRHAFPIYLTAICAFSAALVITGISSIGSLPLPFWMLILIAGIVFIPATDVVISFVQWIISHATTPTELPKLNFEDRVPEDCRTLVAVQAIFDDKSALERAVEAIEVRFLGNEDPNIYYALLADLPDRSKVDPSQDLDLIEHGNKLVEHLNQVYAEIGNRRFYILFRERAWNPVEGKYMAWERKRGKVCELNRLILGKGRTSFILTPEIEQLFQTFRYVLTLDADAQLPNGTAKRLIGTIAHPLNRAQIDPKKRVVTRGYGIIQPRVGVSLTSSHASRFAYIFSGHSGLDPYTQTVSDVYQDLFGEGSYVGKGIYDVQAFEKVIHGRVPENALLSHDLFEGLFARVGLVTDIEVFDEFPSRYNSYAKRQHRWVRGDWQLFPWIFRTVPNENGDRYRSPLSGLERWKLIDNLRRSLVAPSLFLLLAFAWLFLPGSPIFWCSIIALVIAFPVYANVAQVLMIPPIGLSLSIYARGVGRDLMKLTQQALFSFIVLPHQAYLMLHAIFVTLYRIFVSRRNLLEWQTAYHSEKKLENNLQGFIATMISAPVMAILLLVALIVIAPQNVLLASPFLILWFSSPWIAFYLGGPVHVRDFQPNNQQLSYLRGIAYDTWKYFRDHHAAQHGLIPDNVQVEPRYIIAERTSPTNIGLFHLSCVAAYELGFTDIPSIIDSLHESFETLSKLEKYQGHLLNWYQTQTLQPLHPRYVSFVDSGNFIGFLITLREALEGFRSAPLVRPNYFQHLLSVAEAPSGQENDRERLEMELGVLVGDDILSTYRRVRLLQHLKFPEAEQQSFNEVKRLVQWCGDFIDRQGESDPLYEAASKERFSLFGIRKIGEHLSVQDMSQAAQGSQTITSWETAKLETLEVSTSIDWLIQQCQEWIEGMDFRFLFDPSKNLFAVGYNVDDHRRDAGCYDLLASEARLGSLVCIAKGDVPVKHWFSLGRSLANTPGGKSLLSWSGTMFEFLMPTIVTKDFPGTILSETYKAVVIAQRKYGGRRSVPWGISESAYSGVDMEATYQYRAFGVPLLGLKRGLENDLVISPYSSFLALPIEPEEVLKNLHRLENEGLRGSYGFFEAADYTRDRLKDDEKKHIVKSVFAHHQGMSLLSITNFLLDGVIQNLFHTDPMVKSVEILLHERFPQRVSLAIPHQATASLFDKHVEALHATPPRSFSTPHTAFPRTQILSNSRITTMLDNAGSGFTLFEKDISLTRWKEDLVTNSLGSYIFVKDLETGKIWSTTYQPTRVEPEAYEAIFNSDKVEFKRRDFKIGLHTEVTIATDDNVEIRRLTISNFSSRKRSIELTSFAEVVLGPTRGDAAHPAFSKMFIESEFLSEYDTLVFSRRPRSVTESPLFLFHSISMRTVWDRTQYETSRAEFIGRGNTLRRAAALSKASLSGTVGFILDPVASLRVKVELEPNSSETVSFITGASRDRDEVDRLAQRYLDSHQVSRAFEMAWSQSSVEIRNEQFTLAQTHLFQSLGNAILFSLKSLRAPNRVLEENRLTQQNLWRFGISGDLPIVLVQVGDPSQIKLVHELILAHYYLRVRGLSFDLVVVNEYPGGYFQNFHEELEGMLRTGAASGSVERRGGIFLRSASQLAAPDLTLLQAVARVVLNGAQGNLGDQLQFEEGSQESIDITPETNGGLPLTITSHTEKLPAKVEFENGLGGFTADGKSYTIHSRAGALTPLPWSNVIANKDFGTLISESGGGYTWSENSRENRLTPWSNDPVTDPVSEVIFIRDTETGSYWTPTPRPIISGSDYLIEHGFGFSKFATKVQNIHSDLTLCVAPDERLKWWHLQLRNDEKIPRRLEVFLYVDWVLGILREDSFRHVLTSFDNATQTLYAVNHYNNEFAGRCVYIGSNMNIISYTTNRAEFIGRNRDLTSPLILDSVTAARTANFRTNRRNLIRLSQLTGAGYDQCGAIKIMIDLEPGEQKEAAFYLGEAPSVEVLKAKTARFRTPKSFVSDLETHSTHWKSITSSIEVHTPVRSFDVLMNGWLLYQGVSCRINGRTGFYQSGGAFGFRDQLQDTLAYIPTHPELVRSQILLHASRQFIEGDVQHWWHPPTGRGVRTKISDDYLWLPYVVARYIKGTGDTSILDEEAGFLEAAPLGEAHEAYIVPQTSSQRGSVYEHCVRAIEYGLPTGSHGLPLMGCGDWNDGMNEVGKNGKGESVWLGWFLAHTIQAFSPFLSARDPSRAERYGAHAKSLQNAIETTSWDGQWYRRAYFDDGTPLGSAQNDECKIDSLSQTWSIISGLGSPERTSGALDQVYQHLVRKKEKIICLLTPPFNTSKLEPGYIKGYIPGVRENGGQYTHAGAWVVIASALLGRGKEALELFELMNPINHTSSSQGVATYQGEPYVMCGDVYGVAPYEGRAGWSWYTGSAGWLYQAGLHYIIGLTSLETGFTVNPCIPSDWKEYSFVYKKDSVTFHVQVKNPQGVSTGVKSLLMNGQEIADRLVPYKSEQSEVRVEVVLGK